MDLTPKVSAPMCWSLLRCCRTSSLLETVSPNDDDGDDELEDLLIRNELSSTGGTVVTTQHCAIEKEEKSEGIATRKRSVTFEDDQNHSFTYNDKKNDNDNNNYSQSPSTMNATNDGVSTPNYYDVPDIEKYNNNNNNNNNYNAESHDDAPHEMNLIHSSSSSLSSLSPRGGEVNLIQFALLSMLSSTGSSIPKRGSISTITTTYDEYDDTIPDLSLSIDDEF